MYLPDDIRIHKVLNWAAHYSINGLSQKELLKTTIDYSRTLVLHNSNTLHFIQMSVNTKINISNLQSKIYQTPSSLKTSVAPGLNQNYSEYEESFCRTSKGPILLAFTGLPEIDILFYASKSTTRVRSVY